MHASVFPTGHCESKTAASVLIKDPGRQQIEAAGNDEEQVCKAAESSGNWGHFTKPGRQEDQLSWEGAHVWYISFS